MKTTRNEKTEPDRFNKPIFLFRKYRVGQYDAGLLGTSYEAGEIGKAMARRVVEKLQLKLDV